MRKIMPALVAALVLGSMPAVDAAPRGGGGVHFSGGGGAGPRFGGGGGVPHFGGAAHFATPHFATPHFAAPSVAGSHLATTPRFTPGLTHGTRFAGTTRFAGNSRFTGRRDFARFANGGRNFPRYRYRHGRFHYFYHGWWYAFPWWIGVYSGYGYWSDVCAARWGYGTYRYYRCMYYHGF